MNMVEANKIVNVFMVILLIVINTETARILAYYPSWSISHQTVFRTLTQGLIEDGHKMVVITTDPTHAKEEAPRNLTEIDLHEISYNMWKDNFAKPETITGDKETTHSFIHATFKMLVELVEKQLLSDEVQNLLNDKTQQFDLILVEGYLTLTLFLSHIYKVPVISVSSLGPSSVNLKIVGSPSHHILYPSFLDQLLFNHSLKEKVYALRTYYFIETCYENHDKLTDQMLKRLFSQDFPDLSGIKNDVDSMLFLNVHNVWDMNRPVAKNVMYMEALQLKPLKSLPKDLQQYLDSSVNGVIYVSFGTNVEPSLFRPEKLQMLIKVFSKLPYDVLWKWNSDELHGQSQNIRIGKWFPQADLLRHPKIKLMMFQGGLQTSDEAIAAGVPMICIPILGDQWYNAEQIEHHGIGIQIELETVNGEELANNIHTVIDVETHRKNVAKLRSIMHDRPQSSLKRAIWWINYVLRHGGSTHLRSPAANMPWLQYFEIEIVLYFLLLLIALLIFSLFIFCQILRFVTRLAGVETSEKK